MYNFQTIIRKLFKNPKGKKRKSKSHITIFLWKTEWNKIFLWKTEIKELIRYLTYTDAVSNCTLGDNPILPSDYGASVLLCN